MNKLVFVSCSTLLLSGSVANAEKTGKLQEISLGETTNIRSSRANLAGVKDRSLSAPRQSRATRGVREEAIIATRTTAAPNTRSAQPLNPYQEAFQALKNRASELNPTLSGRVNISFVIDRNGKASRISLLGFDATIDQALTTVLAGWQFPKKDSGQFYSSKLTVFATQKLAPLGKKHRKRPRRK